MDKLEAFLANAHLYVLIAYIISGVVGTVKLVQALEQFSY